MILPVNEIFDTIQGEAYWTGMPSTFVRLQGCPVGCPWCDTKHTWQVFPDTEVSADLMLQKRRDSPAYAMMSSDEIERRCHMKHVVITGGEPCMYDLRELTAVLRLEHKTVQIETSGTFEVRVDESAWVTLSPKIGMPGGLSVLASSVERANEIKMPVGKLADVAKLTNFLRHHNCDGQRMVWLQPLSQSPKATALCVKAASEHHWRVSVQTHKYLGVR
jgi:Organic radical activating enzymes